MAYPGEPEHIEYMQYVERVATGDEPGPHLSKEEWRKKRKKQEDRKEPKPVKASALTE